MEISNKKRIGKIKRYFNLIVAILLLVTLFFVLKEMNVGAIITGSVLFLTIMVSQFFQFNYVYYSSEGRKITIHYYQVISFFGKEYNSIEFDKNLLYAAKIQKAFIFSDLSISIKTQKGIAEYPEVSLMGLSKSEIESIQNDLNQLLISRN